MEFIEDYGFAQGWLMINGRYLLTFPDHSIKEFDNRRDYHAYIRRMKKHYGIECPEPKGRRLRRINTDNDKTI